VSFVKHYTLILEIAMEIKIFIHHTFYFVK